MILWYLPQLDGHNMSCFGRPTERAGACARDRWLRPSADLGYRSLCGKTWRWEAGLDYTSSRTVGLEYTGGRSSGSSSVVPGSMQTCNQVLTPSTRCQFGGVLYPVDDRVLRSVRMKMSYHRVRVPHSTPHAYTGRTVLTIRCQAMAMVLNSSCSTICIVYVLGTRNFTVSNTKGVPSRYLDARRCSAYRTRHMWRIS